MALLRPYPERDPLLKGKYTPVPVDTAFLRDLEQMHHLTPQIHWLHPRIFFRSTLRPCLPRSLDKCLVSSYSDPDSSQNGIPVCAACAILKAAGLNAPGVKSFFS